MSAESDHKLTLLGLGLSVLALCVSCYLGWEQHQDSERAIETASEETTRVLADARTQFGYERCLEYVINRGDWIETKKSDFLHALRQMEIDCTRYLRSIPDDNPTAEESDRHLREEIATDLSEAAARSLAADDAEAAERAAIEDQYQPLARDTDTGGFLLYGHNCNGESFSTERDPSVIYPWTPADQSLNLTARRLTVQARGRSFLQLFAGQRYSGIQSAPIRGIGCGDEGGNLVSTKVLVAQREDQTLLVSFERNSNPAYSERFVLRWDVASATPQVVENGVWRGPTASAPPFFAFVDRSGATSP